MEESLLGSGVFQNPGTFHGLAAVGAGNDELFAPSRRTAAEIDALFDGDRGASAAESPAIAAGQLQQHRAALGDRGPHVRVNVEANSECDHVLPSRAARRWKQ